MFGAVFFLVTAEDLQAQGKIDATQGTMREAVEKAAEIVASPVTATWVKTKWGDGYLEKENVFYRMLLILGLSSYERITGDTQYHATDVSAADVRWRKNWPRPSCTCETTIPIECYPADMLWAVAAIQRAARLEGDDHDELAKSLIAAFDGPLKAAEGLPAFQADSQIGPESCKGRAVAATRAYCCLPPNWTRWSPVVGTTPTKRTSGRTPAGSSASPKCRADRNGGFMDVDSGPVLCGSRLGFVGLRHRRSQNGRTDRPRRSADDGGRCLLVADAFWLPRFPA